MRGVELLNKRVLFDESGENAIGLDDRCMHAEKLILTLATVDVSDGDVVVDSPLVLLEPEQLDFYRARGRALRSAG